MPAVIGLMSGTSLDGIDAAYLETDGIDAIHRGPALTIPYTNAFRARLRGILGGAAEAAEIGDVERELTLLHADAVRQLQASTGKPALIGFHGHTILHAPEHRRTWQIGDAALLARALGVPVVADFRSADVAAGGQGAPFVPVYHQALAAGLAKPVLILNIGGVANLTYIRRAPDDILAFDVGPGNALLDDWAFTHTGQSCDRDGALALTGAVDHDFVRRFLAHPYFSATPPKSLDRDAFADLRPDHLSPADGAATLAAITVAAIGRAIEMLPEQPRMILVGGGGRHNPAIMAGLATSQAADIRAVDAMGWDGDALEAQAFGYLAVRSVAGLPLSFPATTGVPAPMTGGRLYVP